MTAAWLLRAWASIAATAALSIALLPLGRHLNRTGGPR
jgi:hypothetical protein